MSLRFPTPLAVPFTLTALTGPPELDVPLIDQLGANWCWAACTAMVVEFYRHTTTQPCEVASLLFAPRNCCAELVPGPDCDKKCDGADVASLYNQFALSADRRHAFVEHGELEKEIKNGRPVEVGLQPDPAAGHLVIVRWAGLDGGVPSVLLNNPWELSDTHLTYDALRGRNWVDTWTGIE